eukprot:gene26570-18337_t
MSLVAPGAGQTAYDVTGSNEVKNALRIQTPPPALVTRPPPASP